VPALPTDSEAVKKALDEAINVEAWIKGLGLEDAENLEKLTIKNTDRGNTDQVLMQYAPYLPAVVAVQAHSHFKLHSTQG
jgi:hypothetical protein